MFLDRRVIDNQCELCGDVYENIVQTVPFIDVQRNEVSFHSFL